MNLWQPHRGWITDVKNVKMVALGEKSITQNTGLEHAPGNPGGRICWSNSVPKLLVSMLGLQGV